jgi:hypothetical protein
MSWGPQTGANRGQQDAPVTKSRWFDVGNARVNAEEKNKKHQAKLDRKRAEKDEKLRNKKGFWS